MMNIASEIPLASAVCAGALAAGSLLRRRHGLADFAFAAGMIGLSAEGVFAWMTVRAHAPDAELIAWQKWSLFATAFLPFCWLLFSLSYARGNAREFVSKWRLALAGAFFLPVGIATVFRSQLVVSLRPSGAQLFSAAKLGWPGIVLALLVLAGSVLVLMNLERTFRASVGTMRWRVKFMLMGVGILFLVRIYTACQELLFRAINLSLEDLNAGTLLVVSVLILRSFFRAGPMDLDVYPSHSVLQGSVTVLLAGIYLLIVGLFAKAVVYVGSGNVFVLEALLALVSLVLFVVLLQSDRLRLRLGRFVSRHFDRPLYDYRTVWRKFTEGTASQVDQTELCRSLVKMVADLFQALSVAIWIVDEDSMTLAASTSLSEAKGRELAPEKADVAEITGYFEENPEPCDVESLKERWTGALKRMHPCDFPKRENRVCLPMIAQGKVAALMILGDRVSAVDFTAQDFDMLRCVGDHATAGLVNVQLAQKLLQARELEAFQTMAAFFVHDLKNAASTLSLMLKNLPEHFEDPAFREDAFRGVSKSVDHINHIIGRLGLLRSELVTRPVETDLNEVIGDAVAGLESEPGFVIAKDLSPLPKLALDREQIGKVVTNLLLNARESLPGRGRVELATRQENGWVVLSVRDEGCGMSASFIERSLFRPFQTTKKNGLGIGMFQSKMIVEVHGGRIAVASEPGKGTTIQVYLPAKGKTG
jgi:putative PEP-CTERM system histidine kinase